MPVRRLIAALLVLALLGCGAPVPPDGLPTEQPAPAVPATTPDEAPAAPGDEPPLEPTVEPAPVQPGVPAAAPADAAVGEAVIGAGGGAIAGADGNIWLDIPAGALGEDTIISVAADGEEGYAWALDGSAFRFEPAGLQFATPARLTMRYDPAQVAVNDPERGFAIHHFDGEDWVPLESVVDAATGTVSAEISSFSRYATGRVAPTLGLDVGMMGPVTLWPLANAEVRTNACLAGACFDVDKVEDEFSAEGVPLFSTTDDGCGFYRGGWAPGLASYPPTQASADGGSAYVSVAARDSAPRAWLEYELNSFALPVHAPGHNTTSTAVSTLTFLTLDAWAPGERRLVLDIDNPGGVTFDLAVAWLLDGGAAGPFNPHVQASAQVALMGCGDDWEEVEPTQLFNVVASPLVGADVAEAGVIRLRDLTAARQQLWIGLHVQTRARGAHGDEEHTVGYGLVEGGQAAATGSLGFVVEPPGSDGAQSGP